MSIKLVDLQKRERTKAKGFFYYPTAINDFNFAFSHVKSAARTLSDCVTVGWFLHNRPFKRKISHTSSDHTYPSLLASIGGKL